ncbi:unnamed protein product [Pelagomonas calceolata]|jgi:hypothetical protein|uniref:Bromo domain-containing protein n=2 Tax=Pelagomonas calceolata TaxID=35677 RepID=A0A8J2WSU6_9STRA|nr:unnamed protein product [Pelagomonas calceolata]|mmetsp:Transcript_20814/g.62068  ORF Transcript_20814/g.62068 Transcript_20814/m.62068 type:complete len:214 (-) Transcript_20814:48-689(-)
MTQADGMAAMTKIINTLMQRPDSVPFREPVDWRGLGLYDYPQVIAKPMDLTTVKQTIERQGYKSVNDCADDIRLIWNNCKKYNQDGSDFYNLADGFSKRFEERFSKVKAENPALDEEELTHAPDLEEKTRFSHNIYRIKQEELGVLVEKLDAKCPDAIDKSTSDDEIEINIDQIDPRTFHDLDRYVRQCLSQSNPKKKKAAGGAEPKAKKQKA